MLSPSLPTSSSPSMLSHSSPPSFLSHNWTHDVFPSFCGEDVRIGFHSHIQKEFKRKGITPFIDNEIRRGESIGPELIKAIRGSKIAIILLSKNYASSMWCLDELVEIMKCKEELGQTAIPIFYKVDPSDVKKLRGYFEKVFEKTCEGKSKENIEKWRHALENVATIAGYDSSTWDNEAAMIEEIATDVSNKLINSVPSSDFNSLVGMRAHMKSMELLLRLDSDEVRMIGIWGPSGIGKSTIARFLFNQHFRDFQLSVFMEDIKRDYPRPGFNRYNAQLQLQKKFLSLILNQKDVTIHHLGVAPDRLKEKKVLVVLDDVDQSEQLNALAKELSWFGPGSRIIITTQDKKILNAHGINHIYEVGFPRDNDALEILCINAFGQNSPYDGFWDLAWEVTKLVGKLPLGLSVMGSYFKGLSKEEWDHELPRLRTRLNGDIENTLKFSYDVLSDEEQALFLHIACFFNGERINKVEEYLAEKFVAVKSNFRVLVEKSLISVYSGTIRMHDLLARLGREIVRKQSLNEPGQRQFLVDDGDIRQVLCDDTLGSRSVVGINFKQKEELRISDGAFERMSNVQFLKFHGDYFHPSPYILGSLKCLPREVRLLHWIKFPMTCLPSNFNPEFLVEINMSFSNLEKLWEGNKMIRNLKWMDLCDSINLKKLPNLSTATNLQELDLSNCSSLVELPFSIGNLTNLKNFDLTGCSSLVNIPSSIGNMTNLKKLPLKLCSSLMELPSSIGNMTNLENLDLSGCSNLVGLPSSIGNLTNLLKLDLCRCSNFVELHSSIGNMTNLETLDLDRCSNLKKLPVSIGNMINLKLLCLSGCSSLVELPYSIGNMTNLEKLILNRCSSLVELHSSIGNITNLKRLDLKKCSSLKKLPFSIGNMTNLEKLDLYKCVSLKKLPSSIGNMINLNNLSLNKCSCLVELPSSIGNMTNLENLHLSGCSNLVELPSSISNMTNLKNLNLFRCSKLLELPSSISNMTNLENLDLSKCSNLVELRFSIGNMTNLLKLDLWRCSNLVEIPSSIGNMTNLERLSLDKCSDLVELPPSIGNMTSLKRLSLDECSSLVEVPCSIGNLHNLRMLYLKGCSKLMALPTNINLKSLDDVDLTDCSSFKSFPEISTNISILALKGTAIEDIPPSIRSWSHLDRLHMSYSENLKKSQHAFHRITELHLDNTGIREIAPWVKEMSRLRKLITKGCTKLVSLPQLPDSLKIIDAENCESLEKLHCSFYKTEFYELRFVNCFKLNQEARDLIIITSTEYAIFPGETVPTYFTYRVTGSSLSMKLNGLVTHFPTFKACLLLVNKPDVEAAAWNNPEISYCIKDKLSGVRVYSGNSYIRWSDSPHSGHLVVIKFEITVSYPELVFEFGITNEDWEIKECGLRPPEIVTLSC